MKDSRCFLEQDILPSFLSTGWFQEWIRVSLPSVELLVLQKKTFKYKLSVHKIHYKKTTTVHVFVLIFSRFCAGISFQLKYSKF